MTKKTDRVKGAPIKMVEKMRQIRDVLNDEFEHMTVAEIKAFWQTHQAFELANTQTKTASPHTRRGK